MEEELGLTCQHKFFAVRTNSNTLYNATLQAARCRSIPCTSTLAGSVLRRVERTMWSTSGPSHPCCRPSLRRAGSLGCWPACRTTLRPSMLLGLCRSFCTYFTAGIWFQQISQYDVEAVVSTLYFLVVQTRHIPGSCMTLWIWLWTSDNHALFKSSDFWLGFH